MREGRRLTPGRSRPCAKGRRAGVRTAALRHGVAGRRQALILGAALLVLLPVEPQFAPAGRHRRIHDPGRADAWLTTFGAAALPYAGFPLLRYGVEYLMLAAAAVSVNAFAGWRPREGWAAGGCFAAAFVVLLATLLSGGRFDGGDVLARRRRHDPPDGLWRSGPAADGAHRAGPGDPGPGAAACGPWPPSSSTCSCFRPRPASCFRPPSWRRR